MIIPVILSGGSGTRLWPSSRTLYPKQFLPLCSEQTMLQETAVRLQNLDVGKALVVCNEEHRFLVAEQMRQLNMPADILLEPVGRNTAPAIALAAFKAVAEDRGEDVLLVLAADHVIEDRGSFESSVRELLPHAMNGRLATFGIVPTEPATGYGYIRAGDAITSSASVFRVAGFVEKPDQQTAQSYLDSGEYLWNSGMFMFRADRYLQELQSHRPDIYECCQQAMQVTQPDIDFIRIDQQAFAACPEDSIDYAVMEKTKDAVMVTLDAGWSDVGSWSALWDIKDKDSEGNVHSGDVMSYDSRRCYVETTDRLVATLGVEDLVVVDTKDALLISHRNNVQDVKKIVAEIKKQGRQEHLQHREVYRPWGKYDSVDCGERYQVKHITVKPGAQLSLQKHHHRAEHWIVVAGTARVTRGEEQFMVSENQSTYIPIGEVHRLENPGKIDLELIEVQSGSYLGEDDIVRLEDTYGR
ncbi:MAG: mannose-1-phosphate guanylyltransferase/mannose-6-phosphate isomerase [Motiliproteus sp.]|nr:mannose-1-phosphate guanylyltransferase/mannose-6-phosphate isomerase [Motiliproteus sp.]MCW9054178.1 mannose-1-phosphate guanylyltransferase/mannose-6-phosphate isomerase [Motiliproteus sp.]